MRIAEELAVGSKLLRLIFDLQRDTAGALHVDEGDAQALTGST
jgi:hypothetical protein